MLLDLAKALSFFVSIVSLYHAAIHTFFVPGAGWRERLLYALVRLGFSGCICLLSGLIFIWPARLNPDRNARLASTLPVRLFLWSTVIIAALFVSSWYLGDMFQQAGPFVSDRTENRF